MGQVIKDEGKTIQEKVNKIDKMMDKIKYQAFGKVTLNSKSNNKKDAEIDDTSAEKDWKETEERTEKEMDKIKQANNSKVGRIWTIRKEVLGLKKQQESSAIINPQTGKLAVSRKEIQDVTLKYCVNTLKNNDPEKEFEVNINEKKKHVKNILESK